MSLLDDLTVALFVAWCISEVAISLINVVNRLSRRARAEDRFSFLGIWLALIVTVALAMITWLSRRPMAGFGDAGALRSLSGWLGCACLVAGIAIRLAAVATLRGQFTTAVTIVAQQRIVDSGPYHCVRHPAYLGLLLSLLGFGLCSGNWISLVVAVGLPLTAVVYRIRVEERALLRHFGPAYVEYSSRTKRLVPGIY
jgi:protein-S-isoprenylcysteine O-methyltransferase Ste14